MPREGAHGRLDVLVRHELRDDQEVVADAPGAEPRRLHGRVDHRRLAAEGARDTRARRLGVGDVAPDTAGDAAVPAPPAVERRCQRRAQEAPGAGQRLDLRPGVAERVVAVADVRRAIGGAHAVGPRARARHHEVVAAQVEALHGQGVQRQERAEGARAGMDALEERRVHAAVGEAALRAGLVVDGREEVGVRPHVRHDREDPLRAPHVDEEIVHEGHAAVGARCVPRGAEAIGGHPHGLHRHRRYPSYRLESGGSSPPCAGKRSSKGGYPYLRPRACPSGRAVRPLGRS